MTGRAISYDDALLMHAAYLTPLSVRAVAHRFRVGKNSVARAFRDWGLPTRPVGWNARTAKPRRPQASIAVIPRFQPPRSWCAQCERRVSGAEAGQCGSRFCAVKHLGTGHAIAGHEADLHRREQHG